MSFYKRCRDGKCRRVGCGTCNGYFPPDVFSFELGEDKTGRELMAENGPTIGELLEEQKKANRLLVAQVRELKSELMTAWDMSNRWMKAAMDLAPMTTMAFDPGAPEAFAESRKRYMEEQSKP
jgi:hypothetical protein